MAKGGLVKVRDVVAVLVTAFVVVFVVQNLHVVDVQVLPWRVGVSVAILVLASFLAGLVIGRIATLLPTRRRSPPAVEEGDAPAALPPAEEEISGEDAGEQA